MNKKLLIIVPIFVLILAILCYFLWSKNHSTPTQKPVEHFGIEKKDLGQEQVPSGFPQDVPVLTGSQLVQNYESTAPDGRKQSTMKFANIKSLTDASATYQKYFEKLGWTAVKLEGNTSTSPILMSKGDASLMIDAKVDPASGSNSIELTLLETKK